MTVYTVSNCSLDFLFRLDSLDSRTPFVGQIYIHCLVCSPALLLNFGTLFPVLVWPIVSGYLIASFWFSSLSVYVIDPTLFLSWFS